VYWCILCMKLTWKLMLAIYQLKKSTLTIYLTLAGYTPAVASNTHYMISLLLATPVGTIQQKILHGQNNTIPCLIVVPTCGTTMTLQPLMHASYYPFQMFFFLFVATFYSLFLLLSDNRLTAVDDATMLMMLLACCPLLLIVTSS